MEKIPFVMNDLERKLDLVKHYREYYLIELTHTVKKRILEDLVGMLDLDAAWYQRLENDTNSYERGFYPERYMDDAHDILRIYKNSAAADMDYAVGDEIAHIHKVRIVDYNQKRIIVRDETDTYMVPEENIIRIVENGN